MHTPRNKQGEALVPGFNKDVWYQHGSRVKTVNICSKGHQFISLDQNSLHIWSRGLLDPNKIEVHQMKALQQPHFISAVCHAVPTGLTSANSIILAACLDNTLKVYSLEKLKLRSSMSWGGGIVTTMLYNTKNDTVITTGAAGVKLWVSRPDKEGYQNEKNLPASDRPWLSPTGDVVPWCFGRFQQAKEQLAFQVPGLKTKVTAADVAILDGGDVSWCNNIQLMMQQQLLLVMFQADVYGFDAANGTRLYAWRSLGQQALVDMVYLTAQQQLVIASREPTVGVWQLQQDGRMAWVRSLGRFAAGLHCVAAAVGRPWLLAASLDGFVVAYSTEDWQQLFRMKLSEAVSGLQFYKPDHFLCLAGHQVKFYKLRQAAQPWMQPSAPLTSLTALRYGLLLATFNDSSIRLLDATSPAADRSALTTVPQLSSAGLLKAAADLAGGRLFALLSNGHVHVWELHLTKPPALQEAWSHLERERCCSVAFMEGRSMPATIATNLGLSVRSLTAADSAAALPAVEQQKQQSTGGQGSGAHSALTTEDHLFIGTAKGEVLVCDVSRQGLLVLRMPVLKLLPVSLLMLDMPINRMVVCGGSVVKVWDLGRLMCIAELEAKQQILCGYILNGLLLLGAVCGRLHLLDLATGRCITSAGVPESLQADAAMHNPSDMERNSSDHDGPVTCVSGNSYLQHFVSCSRDGYVKVYGLDRHVKASVYLACPLAAVAFLNDNGDLLVAPAGEPPKSLLVVKADSYAVTARSRGGQTTSTIFDDVKGGASCRDMLENNSPQPLLPVPRALMSDSTNARACDVAAVPPSQPPHALSPLSHPGVPASMDGGSVASEHSLLVSAAQHGSNRPPVDLDQNRARSAMARAAASPRTAYRQNTISKAVQQQQQQQEQQQKQLAEGVARGMCTNVTGMSATATAMLPAVPSATGGCGSTHGENCNMPLSLGVTSQLQQQQQLDIFLQLQQQSNDMQKQLALPHLNQLPAAFSSLSITPDSPLQQQSQQWSQQQLPSANSPSFFPVLALRSPSAGAPVVNANSVAGSMAYAQRRKHHITAPASSSKEKQLQTRYEFSLNLSQHDKWRSSVKPHQTGTHEDSRGDTNGGSLSSSEADAAHTETDSSSGNSSNSSSSAHDTSGDEQDAAAAAEGGAYPAHPAVELAMDAIAQKENTQAASTVFQVGQLTVRLEREQPCASHSDQQHVQQSHGELTAAQISDTISPGSVCPATGGSTSISSSHSRQLSSRSNKSRTVAASTSTGTTASSSKSSNSPALRKLAGLQPSMRDAVPVVQDPNVFMEDVPPAAELQQVLKKYQAEAAGGGAGNKQGKVRKLKKVRKKQKAVVSAASFAKDDIWQHASNSNTGEADSAMQQEAGPTESAQIVQAVLDKKETKKKKKKKGGTRKSQKQQPVYLSPMDHLMHTVCDAVVLTELKEAEAHDLRQAAAMKRWLTAPVSAGSSSSSKHGTNATADELNTKLQQMLSSFRRRDMVSEASATGDEAVSGSGSCMSRPGNVSSSGSGAAGNVCSSGGDNRPANARISGSGISSNGSGCSGSENAYSSSNGAKMMVNLCSTALHGGSSKAADSGSSCSRPTKSCRQ